MVDPGLLGWRECTSDPIPSLLKPELLPLGGGCIPHTFLLYRFGTLMPIHLGVDFQVWTC